MLWKLLRSQYLFKDLWFTVRKDTCEKSDGSIVDPYYVYEFPDWVTAVAITADGRFIFEKQYRHAAGITMMEIPGGCVDKDDQSLEDAIARELLEETGFRFKKYEYLGKTSANPSTHSNWMHFFLATEGVKIAEQNLDPNEEIELHFLSLAEVVELLKSGKIYQSMHVTALVHALHKLGHLQY